MKNKNPIAERMNNTPWLEAESGKVRVVSTTPEGEDLIVYVARVSSPNQEKADKLGLLKYCLRKKHFSVFEQADLTMEIICPLAIAIQILRHRSACFQQFCVSGDTEVFFDLPGAVAKGKRQLYKMTIAKLYEKWVNNRNNQHPISGMNVRVWNEETNQLGHAHIKEVFKTGIKPVFEVKLKDGKTIKTTKEHKFLTPEGFKSLEEATGLELRSGHWGFTKRAILGTNGIPLHQDKQWLKDAKEQSINNKTGVWGIAEMANVSYHTIRKWLKIHNLCFTKAEVSLYSDPWNKGLMGFMKGRKHTPETIHKMKEKAKRGQDNPLWRGGVDRSERLKITDYIATHRTDLLGKADYKCTGCGESKNLELHHVKPVYSHPELAYDLDNIAVLCEKCHDETHKIAGHYKEWNSNKKQTTLTTKWVEVDSITYVGEEMTYDIEIDHISHNYVANGFIVHNSQRYATVDQLTTDFAYFPSKLREQDTENRQNSIPWTKGEPLAIELKDSVKHLYRHSMDVYNELLDNGVAKEVARFVLPEGIYTRLYMKNNIRNWIHYLQIRDDEGVVQWEHTEIARLMKKAFSEYYPVISQLMEGQ